MTYILGLHGRVPEFSDRAPHETSRMAAQRKGDIDDKRAAEAEAETLHDSQFLFIAINKSLGFYSFEGRRNTIARLRRNVKMVLTTTNYSALSIAFQKASERSLAISSLKS